MEELHQCLCFAPVCPDPVDKYLEETSVRYISPRGAMQSKDAAPHRRTGVCDGAYSNKSECVWVTPRMASGPQPVLCCSPSGPQVAPPRIKAAPPASTRKRKRSLSSADCREKQTCGKKRGGRFRRCGERAGYTVFDLLSSSFRYPSAGPSGILPARLCPPRQRLLQQAGGAGAPVWAFQPGQHHPEIPRLGLHHMRHQVLGADVSGRLLEGLHQRLAARSPEGRLHHGLLKAGRRPRGHKAAG